MFCNSSENLTKEHVLPTWTFANSPEKYFETDVNGIKQFYIKATIPACGNCNNNLLGNVEKYISNLFKFTNLNENYFSNDQKQNIIRWLEIIEYKFQVLEVRKKFLASKEKGFIPFLADFSISVLRRSVNYSPVKVIKQIRNSSKRISIKTKLQNVNSLIIFKSKSETFDFFHSIDNFIFLQIPECKIAMFYFLSKTYEQEFDAFNDAMEIIRSIEK